MVLASWCVVDSYLVSPEVVRLIMNQGIFISLRMHDNKLHCVLVLVQACVNIVICRSGHLD